MASLGFHHHDNIAERSTIARAAVGPKMAPVQNPCNAKKAALCSCGLGCVRGFLPMLLYSSFFLVMPLLFYYTDYSFADDMTRGIVIGTGVLAPTLVLYANDVCCWFNMILFLHIALETRVVDVALTFANAAGTSDRDMALAITAAVVVIVHLVPFLLSDRLMLLILLAYAGVIVNAITLLYLDTSLLLLVGTSSTALLVLTQMICGVCEVRVSLVGRFLAACKSGKFITCSRFEL